MNAILDAAARRGITRLCHFTSATNLAKILGEGEIRATGDLRRSGDPFRPTDVNRRDGRFSAVCCSVEYPNSWYLAKARDREPNFADWVVITLDVGLLEVPDVAFCPHNAAKARGVGVQVGIGGFHAIFEERPPRYRSRWHPPWWPTEDQAEVLVPGPIPASAIRAVIVTDEGQAELEHYRLGLLGVPRPPLVVAPDVFDPQKLSTCIRSGRRPPEREHTVDT